MKGKLNNIYKQKIKSTKTLANKSIYMCPIIRVLFFPLRNPQGIPGSHSHHILLLQPLYLSHLCRILL